ncbi:unnamed protein product [Prunus armeniaca]|uniref:RPW8 domain-containing protein n=1 Tax=Prunus armeniaca TaxID=36596 RepID=A0A6J5VI06_PRUAR|nr:unnamed protein product [Prunus armeniaca]
MSYIKPSQRHHIRLDSLHPLIKEIEKYNKDLDLPDKELENLKVGMEKGIELVHKCSKIRSSVSVRNIEKVVSRIESSLVLQYQDETEVWGAAPELPALVVGLDFPLKELKRKLLNLKDGVSMLVLTAPGGCGKTTLATAFCQDQEVIDTFGDNIFFVTVSSNPNLERIVQELHRRRGSKVPTLGNDKCS